MSEPQHVKHRFRPHRYGPQTCEKCGNARTFRGHTTQPTFTRVLFARMMGKKPNG